MIGVLVCFIYKVAAINCLVCHFNPKKWGGWMGGSKFGFFEK